VIRGNETESPNKGNALNSPLAITYALPKKS
jgi:hypothetical protein